MLTLRWHAFADLPLPTLPRAKSLSRDRSLFSPSDGLRKGEDVEGCGRWYYGPFDCGITWLGACVGPEVTVVAREIDVDYVSIRTSVGSRRVRGIWQTNRIRMGARRTRGRWEIGHLE
jgi:hypothetical protein